MKRILITGAAGFIGSNLADALLARGDGVVGLDNFNAFYDPAIKRRNLKDAGAHENFTLHEGDIRDESFVRSIFRTEKPDVAVHLAAWAGVRPSLERPNTYHENNVIGSQHILDACRDFGPPHLVFASSSSVYGGSTRIPFAEDDPVAGPISPYAATKRMNELMGHVYSHVHGLNVTMLRFFTVYGPRQRPEMAIHKFTRLIDEGQPIPMFGDGSTQRDYTYIGDIIDGVVKAVDTPFRYEIFNLGEHHTTSLRELIEAIAAQLGKPANIEEQPLQAGDVEITYANIDKARKLLGYAPTHYMEDGLARFVEWYRRMKDVPLPREGGIAERLRKVRFVASDVDGCLTDGGMYYTDDGGEIKKFSTRDGIGFLQLREEGLLTGIITAEDKRLLDHRAKKLGVDEFHKGASGKVAVLEEILARRGLDWPDVAYLGDDVGDVELLRKVGVAACPADAIREVRAIADIQLTAGGGHGAFREFAEMILDARRARQD